VNLSTPLMTKLTCSFSCACTGTTPPFLSSNRAMVTRSAVMYCREIDGLICSEGTSAQRWWTVLVFMGLSLIGNWEFGIWNAQGSDDTGNADLVHRHTTAAALHTAPGPMNHQRDRTQSGRQSLLYRSRWQAGIRYMTLLAA